MINLKNGLTLANGLALTATNATFTFQGSQTLGGTGSIDLGTGGTLRTSRTVVGVVNIGAGIVIHGSGGTVGQESGGADYVNFGTIRADPYGVNATTLIASGITNAGTVQVMPGAQMQLGAADFTQTTGTLDVNGLLDTAGNTGSTMTLAGGLLTGGGTVLLSSGTGTLALGGTLAPGHGVGTLSVTGNVTLTSGAHYSVELSGPTGADLLAITGNLDLSGANDSIDVTPLDAGVANGQPYLVVTYTGTLSGTFDHVTPNFLVSYAPGQIFVTPTPEPAGLAAVAALAAVGAFRRRRRREHRRP